MSNETGLKTSDPSMQNQGKAKGENELAVRLSEVARSLQQQDDADEILAGMVHAALELIPGVVEGSISVVTNRKEVGSRAASSDLPRQIDALQAEVGEGPCLDAIYEQQTVRVDDLSQDSRWPKFAERAFELGAKSMLTFQLFVQETNLGALNLYGNEVNAFTDESEHVGMLVAAHAAVAYAEAQKVEQLNQAVSSRDLIGQAKGILMERHKITGQQAFVALTRVSQHTNTKLIDVADHLVTSGELEGLHR